MHAPSPTDNTQRRNEIMVPRQIMLWIQIGVMTVPVATSLVSFIAAVSVASYRIAALEKEVERLRGLEVAVGRIEAKVDMLLRHNGVNK